MEFLTADDLKLVIRDQQLNNLVDNDSALIDLAESEAIEKVKTYLRNRYDVEDVFAQSGTDRNKLVVSLVRDLALYYMAKRQNPRAVPDHIKECHEEAIQVLSDIAEGKAHPNLPALPLDEDGNQPKGSNNLRWGSQERRSHLY